MERKSKKITAFLLAFLMILSVCLPSAGSLGLNGVNAEADSGYEENAGMDISNATSGDATTEAAQATTEAEYITTGNALTGMPIPIANEGTPMPIADGDNGLTVENFHVKVNGEELKDGGTVQNGAEVEVSFEWSIQNNSHVDEFYVDLLTNNFSIDDYEKSDLLDDSNRVVGTWEIKDGKIYFNLNDNFTGESHIHGMASLQGKVDAKKEGEEDRQNTEFQIGDDKFQAYVDFSGTLYLAVQKQTSGSAYFDKKDNKLYQGFQVSLNNWNSENKSLKLSDIKELPQGLDINSIRNISINLPDGTSETLADWNALQEKLKDYNLEANKGITITYEMAVTDSEDAMQQTPDNVVKNDVEVEYTNNKGETVTSKGEAYPNFDKPSIEKKGKVVEDNGDIYVEWTITIDTGLFDWDDLQSVKDELGDNLSLPDGSTIDLDDLKNLKDQFQEEDGKYTFTYSTKVSPDILGTPYEQSVQNKVDMEFHYGDETYIYEDDEEVGIDPEQLIFKKGLNYDKDKNTVKWQIELKVPETGTMTNVILDDDAGWQQSLVLNVTVDNVPVMEDGERLAAAEGILDPSLQTWEGDFKLTDEYVKNHNGQTIVIEVETQPDLTVLGNLPATVTNKITVKFTYEGKDTSQSATADFTIEKSNETLSKSGKESASYRNAIDYTLMVDLTSLGMISKDVLTVNDLLPEHMHLVGEPKIQTRFDYGVWHNDSDSVVPDFKYAVNPNNNRDLSFTMTLTDDYLSQCTSWSNPQNVYVLITYTAQVDEDYLLDWIKEGVRQFHNEAALLRDKTQLDSATSDTPLEYKDLVKKNGTYPDRSSSISYSIIVNPDALNLVDGDYLTGTDVSGNALFLKNNTVKIYEYNGTGDPETDENGWNVCSSAKYTYNQKTHTLTFTLPDSKTLKIEYEMTVNLHNDGAHRGDPNYNDYLTNENSFNKFSLSGYTEEVYSSSKSWSQLVQSANVWAISDTGSISIYKYWTDNGQMVALDGSKFELYQCEWDETGIKNDQKKLFADSDQFTIDKSDKNVVTVSGLPYDNIFALYEVDAKDGFICNKDPYYFALVSTKASEIKKAFPNDVDLYFSGAYIYYENEPAQAKLVLQKTFAGDVDLETLKKAASNVTFTVKNSDGVVVKGPYNLSEFTEKNGTYTLELDIAPGTYTVEETKTSAAGYKLESTNYIVTTQPKDSTTTTTSTGSGVKTGNITIKDGDTVTAAFTNTYSKVENPGKLVLKKTINGSVTQQEAEGALQFTVKSEDGLFSETYKLSDKEFIYDKITDEYTLTLDNLPAGKYTVTETVTDVTGYVLESVTYSVDGKTAVAGKEVSVDVEAGGSTQVAFEDNYRKAKGFLVIEKTIEGDVTEEEAKGALKFTVTDPNGNQTEYTLNQFDYNTETGKYTLTLKDQDMGGYTVTETVTDIEGYVLKSVTYSVNKQAAEQGKEADIELKEDGSTVTVAFEDDYIKEENSGTLVLKKHLKGDVTKEEAKGALEFTVKNNATGEEEKYTLKDFTYDSETDEYTLTLPVVEGGYTITETVKDVEGYILDSVTYSVNGGEATEGDSVEADVKAKETVTVTFEDNYSKKKTESASEQVTETTTETTEETTTEETTTETTTEVTTEETTTEITTEETTQITTETDVVTTETDTKITDSSSNEVKTGDKSPILPICIALFVSLAAVGIIVGKKIKDKKKN